MDIEEFSLWIIPPEPACGVFSEVVTQLSDRFSSPRFIPHVTLLGEVLSTRKDVLTKTTELAGRVSPLRITIDSIATSRDHFRCIYASGHKTAELTALHALAERTFPQKHRWPFEPHLSLMYGEIPAEVQATVVAEIGTRMNLEFVAENLCVVTTSDDLPPEEWQVVGKIPVSES
jgi:2'-5' RNA ligase